MSTDRADAPDRQLRFSVGGFEDHVLTLIQATQFAAAAAAVLAFGFWFLATPSDDGNWYPGILALSLSLGAFAYLLSYLYSRE